jgi:murein DD-endopeptidase MepM/ murein hydrolase activator NlpD
VALRYLGRGILRFVLLPLYTAFVLLNIRLERVVVSARGLFFFLFTNRYIFHAVLLIVSITTISSQLATRNASASSAGQNSLLYALVTQGQDESVEETLYVETPHGHTSYLGADTVKALPDIDFDYDTNAVADLTIPGSVAVAPQIDGSSVPTEIPVDTTEPAVAVAPRSGTETYTVQSGDAVATIARRFGVNVGTIVWANNLSRNASIKPGDTLRIPATSGVLHLVKRGETLGQLANSYKVDISAITQANAGITTLVPGKEILIPGGSPLATVATNGTTPAATKPAATRITTTQGTVRPDIPLAKIKNKAVDVYQELVNTPSDSRAKPEDKEEVAVKASSKLFWPTDLHVINQYYGWAHTGVDLDGDYANAIYAAADGVVETAGWNNGGYGLQVVIDHQNGFRTRYGHSSKLFVKTGDHVKRGQVIAMIGTTGRSTGTHLHFEVYVNGKRVNPLTYIR